MSSNATISAFGLCTDCRTVHTLSVGNSRRYAQELMAELDERNCIDDGSNPKFSTSYLWSDARGQMFGVLECEAADGSTVVLRAFSCQYNGEWLVDGWVPPIPDLIEYNRLTEPVYKELRTLYGKTHDREFFRDRKMLSSQLMKQLHGLYELTNFRGQMRSMTDLFGTGTPAGAGDCCAPKLLNAAALRGLKPLGLSEFFYGKENKSGTRQHKQFYPACAEKCRPILGFMLCGKEERMNGGETSPIIHPSTHPVFQSSSLPIIHVDDDLVVVVKPSGLLSVPGKGPENQDCVTARIKKIFPDAPDHPEVHRLDMDTSGLMVLALTRDAHRELSRQFHDRETSKKYTALLDGELNETDGVIKLPFRLDINNRPKQIYDPIHGKLGITRWKVLGVEDGKTRVEMIPITGRTHQLRVHAASEHGLAVPILGDRLYGTGTAPGQLKLHSHFLSFTHPSTGRKMQFTSAPGF